MLSTEVHETSAAIAEWDDIAATGGFYSSTAWLQHSHAPTSRYLVVRDGTEAVAVAVCTIAPSYGSTLPRYTDAYWLFGREGEPSKEVADQLYPLLSCGPVRGYSGGLLIRPGLSAERRAEVAGGLLASIRAYAAREGAKAIAFTYHSRSDVAALVALDPTLVPVFAESETSLQNVSTLDAYLKSVNASRRYLMKRDLRGFVAHGMRIERRQLAEVLEPLAELVAGHEAKFGDTIEPAEIRAEYVRWLAGSLGAHSHVVCAYQDDRMVGGLLLVVHGSTAYLREIGMVRDAPKDAALYFNLLFYGPLLTPISGIHAIHLGLGTIGAKVLRGSTLRPLWYALAPLGALDPALRTELLDASRKRLAGEVAMMRRYHDEDTVATQLDLAGADALLGRSTP